MSARHAESDGKGSVPFPPAAGFWRRAFSWALDLSWIVPAVWLSESALRDRLSREALFPLLAAVLAVLILGMWRWWGATPGKAVLGLRILGADGLRIGSRQVLLRSAGYLLSLLPLGLGFVMVGLNASRRGLHDQLSSTYVAEVRRGRGGGGRRDERKTPPSARDPSS